MSYIEKVSLYIEYGLYRGGMVYIEEVWSISRRYGLYRGMLYRYVRVK